MLATIGLIAIGIGAGIVIYHYFILSKLGGKTLSHQLAELKKEHQKYQFDVAEHFQQTNEMLVSLNEQYEKVQLHMQSGAELLVQHDQISVDQMGPELEQVPHDPEESDIHKPKDYV